jgi:hypothetical protein
MKKSITSVWEQSLVFRNTVTSVFWCILKLYFILKSIKLMFFSVFLIVLICYYKKIKKIKNYFNVFLNEKHTCNTIYNTTHTSYINNLKVVVILFTLKPLLSKFQYVIIGFKI